MLALVEKIMFTISVVFVKHIGVLDLGKMVSLSSTYMISD